jgi:hypothetical protein
MVRRAFGAQRTIRVAGGSAKPPILSCSTFCPSALPVKKSRSCEVAWIRHDSFCDSSCGVAALPLI